MSEIEIINSDTKLAPCLKILVLDDQESRLIIFRRKLIGHDVVCVKTASDAISNFSEYDFDCVFLDHDLGDKVMEISGPGTGYEVAEWLRDHPDRRPQQIIVHSFNPVGAKNMTSILPGSIYKPGIWLTM